MSFYLLEIGCEELPAAFVPLTSDYLKKEAQARLAELHLPYEKILTGATPRRAYLYMDGLPAMQADREETIQGPPARIAFNDNGEITEAGKKFAISKGLEMDSLKKISTDKGDYLVGTKRIKGEKTEALIADLAKHLVTSIPFAKTMRWGDRDIRFARPLKYLLSIFDGAVLPLDVNSIPSTDITVGHHFLAPDPVKVSDYTSYREALKNGHVTADMADRRNAIISQMHTLADKSGYKPDFDETLLDTVANLVEAPYTIEGKFDRKFLELPSPVLITSMKYHQKFFPVYDASNNLLPAFIGISNMHPADDSLIRSGYERVLGARLSDALFFYNNDKNTPLEERVEMLKKVVYQEKLGTSYEKMERFRSIALRLAATLAPSKTPLVQEAATLCKADLMCEMVYEFPELQGFMGRVYSELQGKNPEVATAIEEHYMPRFSGDKLPASDTGRLLAISDKLDTITSAFAVGMIPTGNVDPYGLRRNTIGIINIIEDSGWNIPLDEIIRFSLNNVKEKANKPLDELTGMVADYFLQRQKQMLTARGSVDSDAFDAAASVPDDLLNIRDRAMALTAAKKSEQFASIAQSFKRINNILKKANIASEAVNENLFEHNEEKALYKLYNDKNKSINAYIADKNWGEAVQELINFAAPLNAYFDKVMVMAPQEEIKNNRLATLLLVKGLFNSLGDLAQIG